MAFVTLVRQPGERKMGQLERRAEVISGGASTFTILQTGLGRRWPMHVQKYFDKLRGVDDHIYKTVLCLLVTRSVRS